MRVCKKQGSQERLGYDQKAFFPCVESVVNLYGCGMPWSTFVVLQVVNRVQKLRKKAGLEPTDSVEVYYSMIKCDSKSGTNTLNRVIESQVSFALHLDHEKLRCENYLFGTQVE